MIVQIKRLICWTSAFVGAFFSITNAMIIEPAQLNLIDAEREHKRVIITNLFTTGSAQQRHARLQALWTHLQLLPPRAQTRSLAIDGTMARVIWLPKPGPSRQLYELYRQKIPLQLLVFTVINNTLSSQSVGSLSLSSQKEISSDRAGRQFVSLLRTLVQPIVRPKQPPIGALAAEIRAGRKLKKTRTQKEIFEEEVAALKEAKKNLSNEINTIDEILKGLQQQVDAIDMQIVSIKSRQDALHQDAIAEAKNIDQINMATKQPSQTIASLNKDIASLRKDLASIVGSGEMQEKARKAKQAQIDRRRAQITEFQREKQKNDAQIDAINKILQNIASEQQKIEADSQDLKNQRTTLQQTIDLREQNKKSLRDTIAKIDMNISEINAKRGKMEDPALLKRFQEDIEEITEEEWEP